MRENRSAACVGASQTKAQIWFSVMISQQTTNSSTARSQPSQRASSAGVLRRRQARGPVPPCGLSGVGSGIARGWCPASRARLVQGVVRAFSYRMAENHNLIHRY